jgi:hypothetical protein
MVDISHVVVSRNQYLVAVRQAGWGYEVYERGGISNGRDFHRERFLSWY